MAAFDLDPKTIDYDALPPLVAAGKDREAVISQIVEMWCTPVGGGNWDYNESPPGLHGMALDRVKLEAADGSPIDLIDLLQRVALRIAELQKDSPDIAKQVRVVLRGCFIPQCGGSTDRALALPCDLITTACKFAGEVRFASAAFGGDALFRSAAFGGDAWFGSAAFGGDALFRSAAFGGVASFGSAAFGGDASFGSAAFGGVALFRFAAFGGDASFRSAAFGGVASFDSAAFGGDALFRSAAFGGVASFGSAAFGGDASFDSAAFGGVALFRSAAFGGVALFRSAAFGGALYVAGGSYSEPPRFPNAWFSERGIFASPSFQTAVFHTDSKDSAAFGRSPPAWGRRLARWRGWTIGRARLLHWGLARGVGELAILTRVSMAALVVVPILAGVWPALRSAVQRYADVHWRDGMVPRLGHLLFGRFEGTPAVSSAQAESFLRSHMPGSFALLFFAALAVVVARSIYQASVPQLVREKSRFDLVRERMEDFRRNMAAAEGQRERDRWLQEAIDFIDEAGTAPDMAWFRHPDLVRHHGRTHWIPSTLEELEEYKPEERDLAAEARAEVKRRVDERLSKAGLRDAAPEEPASDAEKDGASAASAAPAAPKPTTAAPCMSRTSREAIIVQAGAEAQYDRVARQNLGAAAICLWFYVFAGLLLVWLLVQQVGAVLAEVGLRWFGVGVLGVASAGCFGVVIWQVRSVIVDAWLRRERPEYMDEAEWEKADAFTHDLETRLVPARRAKAGLPSKPSSN
ncbi:MAG: pentapeptide repeat-containing protein [Phycisphaerales bacterium]